MKLKEILLKDIKKRLDEPTEELTPEERRLRLTRSITRTAGAFLILAFAVFAYGSMAWFSSNKNVDAADAGIQSAEGPVALFIGSGSTPDGAHHVSVSKNLTGSKLFPISTLDLSNWYYVSSWTRGYYDTANGWTAESSADAGHGDLSLIANGYTLVTPADADADCAYTYVNAAEGDTAANGKTHVAYLATDYNVYTNRGVMDVYLSPEDPITVTPATSGTRQLEKALRIAVRVEDGSASPLTFIYAPYEEEAGKVGNCASEKKGANYYYVSGTSAITQTTSVLAGDGALSAYQAVAETDGTYSVTGVTSLGTADETDGLHLKIFIWLEGTDQQALTGISDNDTRGITVGLNLVGIENNG